MALCVGAGVGVWVGVGVGAGAGTMFVWKAKSLTSNMLNGEVQDPPEKINARPREYESSFTPQKSTRSVGPKTIA